MAITDKIKQKSKHAFFINKVIVYRLQYLFQLR